MSKIKSLLEAELAELSNEPTARAKERMSDAYKRGGAKGLITATRKRMNAITSFAKAEGLVKAIQEILKSSEYKLSPQEKKELEDIAKEAQRNIDNETESVHVQTSAIRKLLAT